MAAPATGVLHVTRIPIALSLLTVLAALAIGATSRPSRDEPQSYDCPRAASAVRIDGDLRDAAWAQASWTADFIDIEGSDKPVPPLRTRAKLLWDDANLYVAAEMAEPRVWATMTQRDAPLFREQAFELFIDPDGDGRNYLELQVNPRNAVCDLVMDKPYRDKGKANAGIDLTQLGTAVKVSDTDGWTLEIAIPWAALDAMGTDGSPPRPGDGWRVNLARMRRDAPDVKDPLPPGAWVWSSQRAVNMHAPERWGTVKFVR